MMETRPFLTETPDMTETALFALSSELISALLTGMRLRGVQYRRVQAGPRFSLAFDARPGHAYFYFMAVGTAILRSGDGALHELSAGNAVFMPHGGAHQLLSEPDMPVTSIDRYQAAPLGDKVDAVDTCPSLDATPGAILFYGCMEFDLGGMQGLGPLMSEVMVADAMGHRYPGLLPILASMKSEVCSGRVGFAGILARLAEVAAAMIVRGWVECGCDNASGLVAALRDPRLARAILALHRQPGRNWTVEELAAECHSSRSVFAERFQATIGTPPLRYAAELRMHLARQWLSQGKLPVDTVAQQLGYASQAAFSRAYKRVTGQTPGVSRRMGGLSGT